MRGVSDAYARARRSAVRGHRASFCRVDDDSCAPSGRHARHLPGHFKWYRTILLGCPIRPTSRSYLVYTTWVVLEVVLRILVHKSLSNSTFLIFDGRNMNNICTCKPYLKARAAPPTAPRREVQFFETTGYDSRRGTGT